MWRAVAHGLDRAGDIASAERVVPLGVEIFGVVEFFGGGYLFVVLCFGVVPVLGLGQSQSCNYIFRLLSSKTFIDIKIFRFGVSFALFFFPSRKREFFPLVAVDRVGKGIDIILELVEIGGLVIEEIGEAIPLLKIAIVFFNLGEKGFLDEGFEY